MASMTGSVAESQSLIAGSDIMIRVRVEIMGSHKNRIVGKSQSALILINGRAMAQELGCRLAHPPKRKFTALAEQCAIGFFLSPCAGLPPCASPRVTGIPLRFPAASAPRSMGRAGCSAPRLYEGLSLS
jgi:hypothetical protein